MRFVKLTSILLVALSLSAIPLLGQEIGVQKSTEKIRINGRTFYVHSVKKGETVYSLTKAYNTTEETLMANNPELADGLKEGQILRIPSDQKDEITSQASSQQQVPDGMVAHEVKRKETLYSISREYNVTVNDIKNANPTIDDNIKKGQTLYIPISKALPPNIIAESKIDGPVKVEANQDAIPQGSHIYHTVQKGETLYSITQRYDVDEEVLRAINGEAFKNNRLMEGAVLRIPKYEVVVTRPEGGSSGVLFPGSYPETPYNTYQYTTGSSFNVSILLPFHKARPKSDDGSGLGINSKSKQNSTLEFYEGALLAVDSLRKTGLSVNLSVFDISERKGFDEAIQNPAMQQAQLIIAAASDKQLDELSNFANRRQVPLVAPLNTLSDSILSQNPNIIQARTSNDGNADFLLNDVCGTDKNVLIIHRGYGDTTLLHTYKAILDQQGCKYGSMQYSIARSEAALQSRLSKTASNHIVIASTNDQAFIADVLETLNKLITRNKYNVAVYGKAGWRRINSIKIPTFYNVNLRVAQPFYVDYTANETKQFVQKFRYYYKAEPSNYAFHGYDLMLYFLDCLKTYGPDFIPYLSSNQKDMLQSRFNFSRVEYGGMKNNGVFLLEFQPSIDIIRK